MTMITAPPTETIVLPHQLIRSHLWAVGLIAALNGLDIITTLLCLRSGGVEGNPLAKFLLDYHLLWPSKIFLPIFTVALVVFGKTIDDAIAARWKRLRPRWLPRVNLPDLSAFAVHNLAWFVCGVYSLVVVLNTLTYLSLVTS